MSEKKAKMLRKIARKKIADFTPENFIQVLVALPFFTRLKFCIGVMLRKT
jgi:hypothetical protein